MKTVFLLLILTTKSFANVFDDIRDLEIKNNLPKDSLRTIIKMESNFNPSIINKEAPIRSYGIGQLTVETAKSHCNLSKEKILDYYNNLRCSAKVFKYQISRYKGDLEKAVVAYNMGTPCICSEGFFKQKYGKTVKFCYKKLATKLEKIKCSTENELMETPYLRIFRSNIILST